MTNRSAILTRSLVLLGLGLALASGRARAADPPSAEPWTTLFPAACKRAAGAVYDGASLWVADIGTGELLALDPAKGTVTRRLTAPGPRPLGLAWDGKLLWVSDQEEPYLFGLDPKRALVVQRIESPCKPCLGLAFDGTYLWTSDGKQIHQLSTEDGTTIRSFNAPPSDGEGRATEELGLAWTAGSLWVSDRNKDRIYRIDPANGEVQDILPTPGPYAAGLAAMDGSLVVVDRETRQVSKLVLKDLPFMVRSDPRRESLEVVYEVANYGPGSVTTAEIFLALPDERPNQQPQEQPVFEPAPSNIVVDQWGQRFARFAVSGLGPDKTFRVAMKLKETLWAVRYHIDPARVKPMTGLPPEVRRYLSDGSKYAIHDPVFQKAAKEAVGSETIPGRKMRLIAKYVQDRMHYELSGGWNIAPTVLQRGSGSCSEYTFVFVALCRAAGIPARYVGSVVVRGDNASTDDVFHRWAEVWIPGVGWIPADVQHGDSPTPEGRADPMLSLDNRFVVTTQGGGGSSVLGWTYNGQAKFSCQGQCHVVERFWGDWEPGKAPVAPAELKK